jgi:5-hydroxyisourate hydrolase
MAHLTTHVLDTASGKPAAGLRVVLRRADAPSVLVDMTTNADGRTGQPLLDGEAFKTGHYEIAFHVGDYFRKGGVALTEPAFLDVVPVRFSIAQASNTHIPLLISPYGYSTYRGS